MANPELKYPRVLLKLSGELFGNPEQPIDHNACDEISQKILNVKRSTGVEMAIVVGGGNIYRGRQKHDRVDAASADYMGMLATAINGKALQESLERLGDTTRLMTAIRMEQIGEFYIQRKALSHMDKGRTIILACGTGLTFFSTDTAAAQRAAELNCNVVLKATNVDGVYSEDPHKNGNATKYETLTYQEALNKRLEVMDATAFTICQQHKMPIIVFNIKELDHLDEVIRGRKIGTLVHG